MSNSPLRVLILCTGNTARSQMAEALLRHLSHGRVEAFSAGSAPGAQVHPLALATLRDKYHLDAAGLRPKSVDAFVAQPFDAVITVCDSAAEVCPVFPGAPQRIHWSFEDPAAVADPDQQRKAFENVASGLEDRLRSWLSRPDIKRRLDASAHSH
jgi:protein-tyrosine-phosphatase